VDQIEKLLGKPFVCFKPKPNSNMECVVCKEEFDDHESIMSHRRKREHSLAIFELLYN
jgi:hypothetical protein